MRLYGGVHPKILNRITLNASDANQPQLMNIPGCSTRLRRIIESCLAHGVADTRHGRLVRGSGFGVRGIGSLYDLMYAIGSPRGLGPGPNPVDVDCGHASDSRPRHQRQAAGEPLYASPHTSATAMSFTTRSGDFGPRFDVALCRICLRLSLYKEYLS